MELVGLLSELLQADLEQRLLMVYYPSWDVKAYLVAQGRSSTWIKLVHRRTRYVGLG